MAGPGEDDEPSSPPLLMGAVHMFDVDFDFMRIVFDGVAMHSKYRYVWMYVW